MKKYLVLGALLLSLVAIPVFAQTTITAEQIIQALMANPTLLAQIRALILGGNNINPACTSYTFTRDLYAGLENGDVGRLTSILYREGLLTDGRTQTDTFVEGCAAAVVKFQGKYDMKQTGYFGP